MQDVAALVHPGLQDVSSSLQQPGCHLSANKGDNARELCSLVPSLHCHLLHVGKKNKKNCQPLEKATHGHTEHFFQASIIFYHHSKASSLATSWQRHKYTCTRCKLCIIMGLPSLVPRTSPHAKKKHYSGSVFFRVRGRPGYIRG